MTILTQTVMQPLILSIDTDRFTREDWEAFIKAHVPGRLILAAARGDDLFPFEWLKEKALQKFPREPFTL